LTVFFSSRLREIFHKYEDSLKNDLKNVLFLNSEFSKKNGGLSKKDGGLSKKDAELSKKDTELSKKEGDLVKQVMYCLQPAVRSNITVFNLNSDSNLSETIFRSICQCKLTYVKDFLIIQFHII